MSNDNTVHFDKLRKARQRKHRIRQLLILLGIGLLVLLGVYLSEVLVERDVSTRLSDTIAAFGGSGYPIDLPGGIIRDIGNLNGNLAVLNDTNLYIYNRKGKLVQNIQQMTERTALEIKSGRALTYDIGGRELKIHSPTKTLYTHSMEDMLIFADLGNSGGFITVTAPRQFVAQVSAYNANFEWQFTWYSSDYMVSGAALSPKGDRMAVACVDAVDGVLESIVYFFQFNVREEIAQVALRDELVVDIDFAADNRVTVLTERGYYTFDAMGNEIGHYELDSLPLQAFESNGREMLLYCGSRDDGTQKLVLLSEQARELAIQKVEGRVLDIALSNHSVYLLRDYGISHYNHSLESMGTEEMGAVQRIVTVGERLYFLTQTEIEVWGIGN